MVGMMREILWMVTYEPGMEEVYLHRLIRIGQLYDENDAPNPEEEELAFIRKNYKGIYTAFNLNHEQMTNGEFRILLRKKDLTDLFRVKYPEVAEDFGMKKSESQHVVLFMPN
jgi:hypothetical protein